MIEKIELLLQILYIKEWCKIIFENNSEIILVWRYKDKHGRRWFTIRNNCPKNIFYMLIFEHNSKKPKIYIDKRI